MASYQFYRLDGAGKIVSADWVDSGDDERAIEEACVRADRSIFELGHSNRLVAPIDKLAA